MRPSLPQSQTVAPSTPSQGKGGKRDLIDALIRRRLREQMGKKPQGGSQWRY